MRVDKRKLLRLAAGLLALLLILVVAAYGFLLWESHRQRQRAEELLRDLQTLKIGETPTTEVLRLVGRWAGKRNHQSWSSDCGTKSVWYDLKGGGFAPVADPFGWQSMLLSRVGVRPWWVGGSLIAEGGRLVCVRVEVAVYRADGWRLEALVRAEPGMPASTEDLWPPKPYFGPSPEPPYSAGIGHDYNPLIEYYSVRMTQRASTEEWQRAFDINLDCLTQWRECRRACELMPSVWKEKLRAGDADDAPPFRELSDPRCQAVLAAGEKK